MQKSIPYIFAFTLFLSATLIFSVQPMLGKMMLPFVGGSPSGWAVAMFFFQTCLLTGYALAFLFSKLPPFLNILAVLLLFIPGALFLPIIYQNDPSQTISPLTVFIQLTLSTAVPFLTLSTLAPGLQRLFSFSTHSTAGDPYYLYAASNLGSFVGLLSYPLILEPLTGLTEQSHLWMLSYGALFFCVIICALVVFINRKDLINFKFTPAKPENQIKDQSITWKQRFKWLILAAVPSSLMLGVTTEITTDIASTPMMWVIPLGLYLLTNIIAFSKRIQIDLNLLSVLHMLGIAAITVYFIAKTAFEDVIFISLPMVFVYLVVFTITALLLHKTLANSRPQTSKLTEFYLLLALGGALGGSFNAFIAPFIFNDAHEFQIVLILSLLLNTSFYAPFPSALKKIVRTTAIIAAPLIIIIWAGDLNLMFIYPILIFLVFFSLMHAKITFATCAIVFALVTTSLSGIDYIHKHRNFFGITKVYDGNVTTDPDTSVRIFLHGTTIHGFQAKNEKSANKPHAYYGIAGPIGDVFKTYKPKDVAVLGLGIGQLACHTARGRKYTFFEIDPDIADIAKTHFTQLEKCGHKEIIIGDARLELENRNDKYDMIFVDAFSSDSIPTHLVTSEALELYFSKIKKNGPVIVNISNRHINLSGPLAATAKKNGYLFRTKTHIKTKEQTYQSSSEWVVLTKNKKTAKALDKHGWKTVETTARPWTDDYSNLLTTLKILKPFKTKEPDA